MRLGNHEQEKNLKQNKGRRSYKMEKQIENLEIINPKTAWVIDELEKLIREWEVWQSEIDKIEAQPYDPNIQSDVFKDGEDNMNGHEILQVKTLTFMNNNIKGHGFITGFDGNQCDRNDLRLRIRVKHRLQNLRILRASLEYAWVPESVLKKKSKELAKKVIDTGVDAGSKILLDLMKTQS